MSGYFGTEVQQRLQAQAETSVDFINATPGACQTGRTMGCDDPDRLGWKRIIEFLDRDGICGFRLIPINKVAGLTSRLTERGYRFDAWDVFLADRATALTASEAILSRGLPDGLVELEKPNDPESEYIGRIQTVMGAAGVVPFSGSMLTGVIGSATTVAVATGTEMSWPPRMPICRTMPTVIITGTRGVGLSPWQIHSEAKGSATISMLV
jgi:hypothetical protein